MALTIGTQLGSYEINALLGKGGMGEVYRARDTKLKREVAIKLLSDEFSRDPERVNRFQREAEVLASLSHPNIAAIHSLEEANGTRFLVLELIEGETLADRIARGPIPVEEALDIARSICEALEAAHEKGIIHRDLKPANVKTTPTGNVKVLDFGLAKAMSGTAAATTLSNSSTLVSETMGGAIIGTAAYMSPEQARGFSVDQRCDVFSFGCTLFEMLTGRRAFQGETGSDILAAVLTREPDFALLPADLNPKIRESLCRSLEKNPRRRWYAIGDLRIEIEAALTVPIVNDGANLGVATRRSRRAWPAWTVTGLAIIAFTVLIVRDLKRLEPTEARLQVVTPPTADAISMAVSPDGRKLVFVGSNQSGTQLFLRPLDSLNAQPLPGTDGASYPFWSPDSRSIGFFSDTKLKRIDLPGGAVQVLVNSASYALGGTWNQNGMILFSSLATSSIFRVAATGGPVVQVTHSASPRATFHSFPYFLPDGRHFLFYAQSGPDTRGVYWGDLESMDRARLFDSESAAVYSPSGHLLFVRQNTLFAQRFDAQKRQVLGGPFPVVEQIALDALFSVGAFSSGPAVLAYRTGNSAGNRQLVWFDRSGKPLGDVGPPDGSLLLNPELSPDGDRVAFDRAATGNRDIWVLEPAKHIMARFTFDPALHLAPVWSPDGSRMVFSSASKGPLLNLSLKSGGAGGEEQLLETPPQAVVPLDWSRDDQFIIYRAFDPKTAIDLWVLPLGGDRKPYPFVATPFNEANAQFSPDTRWVAYQSDESGRFQIYVQPFPGPGGKLQLSNAGGTQPRWNRNGKELFYIAADGKLMSVAVETIADNQMFKAATPVELFASRIVQVPPTMQRQQYAVSSDGQRFLINVPTESDNVSPITVVLNWPERGK